MATHESRLVSPPRYPRTETAEGRKQTIEASAFVVACGAIESARLLLNSKGPKHPNGLANGSGLVGRNLLFSTFGAG